MPNRITGSRNVRLGDGRGDWDFVDEHDGPHNSHVIDMGNPDVSLRNPAQEPEGVIELDASSAELSEWRAVSGQQEASGTVGDPLPVDMGVDYSEAPSVSVRSVYDSERGWIVDGEDEAILREAGMNRARAREISSRIARKNSANDAEKAEFEQKISKMGNAERDAYMRFSDL